MITISPGSTSRTNSADIISNAQVSDAAIKAPEVLPIASGRNPYRSLAAISLSSVKIVKPHIVSVVDEYHIAPNYFCQSDESDL